MGLAGDQLRGSHLGPGHRPPLLSSPASPLQRPVTVWPTSPEQKDSNSARLLPWPLGTVTGDDVSQGPKPSPALQPTVRVTHRLGRHRGASREAGSPVTLPPLVCPLSAGSVCPGAVLLGPGQLRERPGHCRGRAALQPPPAVCQQLQCDGHVCPTEELLTDTRRETVPGQDTGGWRGQATANGHSANSLKSRSGPGLQTATHSGLRPVYSQASASPKGNHSSVSQVEPKPGFSEPRAASSAGAGGRWGDLPPPLRTPFSEQSRFVGFWPRDKVLEGGLSGNSQGFISAGAHR